MSDFGKYHSDGGPIKAISLRENENGTHNVGVFSDGDDAAEFSVGFTVKRDVPQGTAVGQFTPPAKA